MRLGVVDKEQWHDHYTLFPVMTVDGKFVWLETVSKRRLWIGYACDDFGCHSPYRWEYKLKENQ